MRDTHLARIFLIVGPVGAGKSTLAQRLAVEHRAVRLTLDEWMTTLFRPDRPNDGVIGWYVERARRCVDQIWRVANDVLATDTDVILEIGLLQRHQREDIYARARERGIELTLIVVDAPRDLRRQRVMERNHEQGSTFSVVVPLEFFERASDLWEPPGDDECLDREVRWVEG
ncbi:MAG: ATP-binding protein [Vicinamibacteria bacterium]|nr:ATP-binding protein [Vicinamibacteria bacterium]